MYIAPHSRQSTLFYVFALPASVSTGKAHQPSEYLVKTTIHGSSAITQGLNDPYLM